MRVACYADDAKEPELIGEVSVPIDDVLKQGEVDGELQFLPYWDQTVFGRVAEIPFRMVRIQLQG